VIVLLLLGFVNRFVRRMHLFLNRGVRHDRCRDERVDADPEDGFVIVQAEGLDCPGS
jgi:hypothetical protein